MGQVVRARPHVSRSLLLVSSVALAAALAFALTHCGSERQVDPARVQVERAAASASAPRGDALRGHAAVERFECNRCHDGAGVAPAPMSMHCVSCHRAILDGSFDAPKATLAAWQKRIVDLLNVPSLAGAGKRLRRDWIAGFLLAPTDLRPHLSATMPRLAITVSEARDVATYLAPDDEGDAPASIVVALDFVRGRALFADKGCAACHAFEGAPPVQPKPPPVFIDGRALDLAMTLAPDLRHARDRVRRDVLAKWIADPSSVAGSATMPTIPMTADEARVLAAYVVHVPLAPPARPPAVPRLPLLARRVAWDEVMTKVFRSTCWHCHGAPEYAVGDGGPGNTGGFGFEGRGLNVAEYEGIASGSLDDEGNRRSVFALEDGTPRLVRTLLARRDEESGTLGELRGMPLGLPSLSPEDVQLVESWVAQGRPR